MSKNQFNEDIPPCAPGLIRIADISFEGMTISDVNPAVFHNMGVYHQFGTGGFPRDLKTAFKLYSYAKELGVIESIHNLGYFHEFGLVVPLNLQEAFQIYTLCAEKGFIPSVHALAGYYQRGRVGPKDYQKAFELYTLAANQGYYPSQCNLGLMYKNGNTFVEVDLIKAREWLTKAATQGDELAINALVDM